MESQTPKQTLLNAFKGIRLEESTHTYFVNKIQYPSSTTTIIGQFAAKFDEDRMSKLVAKRDGLTQEQVLASWKATRDEACNRGTLVHKCLEFTPFKTYDEAFAILEDLLPEGEFIQLFNDKEISQVKAGLAWYQWLKKTYGDRYEILVLELMMFMPEFKHCGTADIILWDNVKQGIVIADWKTNKDLFKVDYYKTRRKQYFKYPFNELLDCPYSKYVLQFSHYQMMIEECTYLRVVDRWCIWLTYDNIVTGYAHKGEGWVQYNTPSYSRPLLNHFKQVKTVRPTKLSDLCKPQL